MRSVLSNCADRNYDEISRRASDVLVAVREEICDVIEAPLNEQLKQATPTTYLEKRKLANWLNDELRRLDLAIAEPKTGRHSHLETGPGSGGKGQFRFLFRDETGARHRSGGSGQLGPIRLRLRDELEHLNTCRSGR